MASVPTAWRTLEAIDGETLAAIAQARAAARAAAWAAGADPGFYVIDFDGTLIGSHSDKEGAAPTYKRGFGFHPLLAILDGTGEALAGILRPGNAASNATADHVRLLDLALAQLPVDPAEVEVIARADSAALTHGFVNTCRDANVRFIIGHDLTESIRNACLAVPQRRWRPAITADGSDERDGAEVAEITDLVDLGRWPDGTRAIARREEPHPGAQLTFTDADGHRFQVLITDLADDDIAYLEALHRGRGRAEKRICDLKDTGLANLPSADFTINTAWMTVALVAHDLLCRTRRLVLDGDLARAEPKRLRYSSCTPPGSSPTAHGASTSASPPTGPGPPNSLPPSSESACCGCRPEPGARGHRRPLTTTQPGQPPTTTSADLAGPRPRAATTLFTPLIGSPRCCRRA